MKNIKKSALFLMFLLTLTSLSQVNAYCWRGPAGGLHCQPGPGPAYPGGATCWTNANGNQVCNRPIPGGNCWQNSEGNWVCPGTGSCWVNREGVTVCNEPTPGGHCWINGNGVRVCN